MVEENAGIVENKVPSIEELLKYFAVEPCAPAPGISVTHFCSDSIHSKDNWTHYFEGVFDTESGMMQPIPAVAMFDTMLTHAEVCVSNG